MNPEDLARLEEELGLNDPVYLQYGKWLGRVLQGDFGMAVTSRRPVGDEIMDRLPNTLYLMGTAWLVTLLLAIPIGVYSALRQYSKFDHAVTAFTFVGQSVPIFWLGLILILIFYLTLDNPVTGGPLLPSGGVKTLGADFSIQDRLVHLILPVTMLAAGWIAWYSRFLRASMLEVIHLDYVRTARAKGVDERGVVVRHALRNAMIPVVTIAGIQLALLLSGAVVIEIVFSIRGLGRLLVGAIFDKDYPMVQGVILLVTVIFVLANLAVDVVYTFLDPRIHYG